jgi:hypothetical protein
VSRIEGNGKRSLRRPKLSTRKFSTWKKKKNMIIYCKLYVHIVGILTFVMHGI